MQQRLQKNRKNSRSGAAVMLALLLLFALLFEAVFAADYLSHLMETEDLGPYMILEETESPEYSDLIERYRAEGLQPGIDSIQTDSWNTSLLEDGLNGYDGKAFRWGNEEAFTIDFEIGSTGLYVLAFDYLADQQENGPIQRGILIDGVSCSSASETCPFFRRYTEDGETYLDQAGDEKPARMIQICEWRKQYLLDTNALFNTPLQFYLTEGKHTLSLLNVTGKLCVGALYIEPAQIYHPYQEYYQEHAGEEYKGEAIVWEAEKTSACSDRIIRRISDSDPATSPFVYAQKRLNAIGGDRWANGWQTLEWEISVPESGLYRMDMRVLQQAGEGLTVYRQLTVDGQVPFKEALAFPIDYTSKWKTVSAGGREQDYYLYLTEGEHVLALTAVIGDLSDTAVKIREASAKLASLLRDINMIVGTDPDLNFDYELDKKISWLIPELSKIQKTLEEEAEHIRSLTGKQTTLVMNLNAAAEEVADYIRKPKLISTAAGTNGALTALQTNLATWYSNLLDIPLTLDTIALSAPGTPAVQKQSNVFQRIKATFLNFFSSFTKDYDKISSDGSEADKTISVWIARGREWGETLQKLCDEDFTPRTGIHVKINILPSGSVGVIGSVSPVLLSLVSGNSPNVCIGSDATTPVELAIRESVVDLSTMEGYEDVVSHFVTGAMEPLVYEGGTYALPENMDFQFMIYRKDILDRLNLNLPDTWDELYTNVLPTLKQNNYDFYIPITTSTTAAYQYCAFYTYLYQRGGEIYSEDGLSTLLSSDVSVAAFKQWTESYTRYNMPREINVFNHFRMGDVPIFIGGLNEYLNLKVAAPELAGKWGVALVPGTIREGGLIDRHSIGALTTSFIFKKTDEENTLSWEFLKWYMSTETQYRYAEDIEAEVSMAARWFTSNTDTFEMLSWDARDLKVFREAMQWMRNPRNVLGGYMTGRQLNNAWTRTVLNGQNYIESLEDAIDDIEAELQHKQAEYGVGDGK